MDDFISVWHGGSLYDAQAKKEIILCSSRWCKSDVTESKYATCQKCRDNKKIYRQKRKKAKYARGECSTCESPRREDRTTCITCGLKQSEIQKKIDTVRRKVTHKNFCLDCFKKAPVSGYTRCRECLIDNAKRSQIRRNKRAAAGLCNRCGEDKGDKETVCVECVENMRLRRIALKKKRKSENLCIYCARPSESTTCSPCSEYLYNSKKERNANSN